MTYYTVIYLTQIKEQKEFVKNQVHLYCFHKKDQ